MLSLLQPFTRTMLELSTAHLTPTERKILLADAQQHGRRCMMHNQDPSIGEVYGHCIALTTREGVVEDWEPDMSTGFVSLLTRAVESGCSFVYFDRDGPVHPELPAYGDDSDE